MNTRQLLAWATAITRGPVPLVLLACNTSPDVVSFNTPELCEYTLTGITQFVQARAACDSAGCQVCIETTYASHALTYAITPDDHCVCRAPLLFEPAAPDAGLDGGVTSSTDASATSTSEDAGTTTDAPVVAADGCDSLLNLSEVAAVEHCDDKKDCHVCVERVDFDDEPRRYMAHECGCPSPHRLE